MHVGITLRNNKAATRYNSDTDLTRLPAGEKLAFINSIIGIHISGDVVDSELVSLFEMLPYTSVIDLSFKFNSHSPWHTDIMTALCCSLPNTIITNLDLGANQLGPQCLSTLFRTLPKTLVTTLTMSGMMCITDTDAFLNGICASNIPNLRFYAKKSTANSSNKQLMGAIASITTETKMLEKQVGDKLLLAIHKPDQTNREDIEFLWKNMAIFKSIIAQLLSTNASALSNIMPQNGDSSALSSLDDIAFGLLADVGWVVV